MDNDYNTRLTFSLVENVFRLDELATELSREVPVTSSFNFTLVTEALLSAYAQLCAKAGHWEEIEAGANENA